MTDLVEIPPEALPGNGQRAIWRAEGRCIAVFNVDGQLYAIDDSCPHAGASLFGGIREGRTIQCRAHGLRFDLASGCMPGAGGLRVRAYRVELHEGRAFLHLTDDASVAV